MVLYAVFGASLFYSGATFGGRMAQIDLSAVGYLEPPPQYKLDPAVVSAVLGFAGIVVQAVATTIISPAK